METLEDHVIFLRRFLSRAKKYNIKLSPEKCAFGVKEIIFCGHHLSAEGAKISPKRLTILRQYPYFDVDSKKKNADLSLYGFYGFHNKWVKNYSMHERKMRDLIKSNKENKISSEKCNAEIKIITEELKNLIEKQAVKMPNKNDDVTIVVDSSGRSYGGMIYCDRGVIAYSAGSHSPQIVTTHPTYLLELRALTTVVQKFYKYMRAAKSVTIKSDNLSSTFALSGKIKRCASVRACQYILNLQMLLNSLDFKIVHLSGVDNQLADCLSRLSYDKHGNFTQEEFLPKPELVFGKLDEEQVVHLASAWAPPNLLSPDTLLTPENTSLILDDTEQKQLASFSSNFKNKKSKKLCEWTFNTDNTPMYPKLSEKTNSVKFSIPFLSENFESEIKFFTSIHKKTHHSAKKMYDTFKARGFQVNLKTLQAVEFCCKTCNKYRKVAPLSKLHPRESPSTELEEFHIDFVVKSGEHSSPRGYRAIFTVLDSFSRYFLAFPTEDMYVKTAVTKLKDIFITLGRLPNKIFADNAFDSDDILKTFCDDMGITYSFRASHLSRSCMVERMHRELHAKIKGFTGNNHRDWDLYLHKATYSLNTQIHSATQFTPFFLMFGFEAPDVYPSPRITPENEEWKICKKYAQINSNLQKDKYRSDFQFPTLEPGLRVQVFYKSGKNETGKTGLVIEDDGGAEALVLVGKSNAPIKVHKGMLKISKDKEEDYKMVFKLPDNIDQVEYVVETDAGITEKTTKNKDGSEKRYPESRSKTYRKKLRDRSPGN